MIDRLIHQLERFFSSSRFPLMALSIMASMELLLIAMLFVPSAPQGIGAFAEEFRVWCFGYDAATGKLEAGYVTVLLAHPLVLGGVVLLVWFKPLRAVLRAPLRAVPYVGSALALVLGAAFTLVSLGSEARATELPFPAEQLRLAQPAPAFELTDQDGQLVTLRSLRGRVVVVTGVYAGCYHTCPLIMAQAKRALSAIDPEQRAGVSFVAVTLNPERDDRAALSALAARENVSAPGFRFLTGKPELVNAALDELDIARRLDPKTGMIEHANLYLLYDRQSRLSYRLTLGERQERWLVQALRVLLAE